jgi:hypothetical protein
VIEQNEPLRSGCKESEGVPPAGLTVWVVAGGYRVMAFRDLKGVWRCIGDGAELKGVTRVECPEWCPSSHLCELPRGFEI